MENKFANIALNLPLYRLFTYIIPDYISNVEEGVKVLVPFGNKILTGIVVELLSDYSGDIKKIKSIKTLLDERIHIPDDLMKTIKWMSSYYLSPPGELFFSSFPKGADLFTKISYELSDSHKEKYDLLKSDQKYIEEVYDYFTLKKKKSLTIKQINNKFKIKDADKILKVLLESDVIRKSSLFNKQIPEKYIKIIKKNFFEFDKEILKKNYSIKSEKQFQALELLDKLGKLEKSELHKRTGISYNSLNKLIDKELLIVEDVRQMRQSEDIFDEAKKEIILNDEQINCKNQISEGLNKNTFEVFLLHGVTGSGKTEVYINVIQNSIRKGKNAIVLVPEISLTPQLIHRFRNNFGDIIGVIHSRLSEGERLDTYERILNNKIKIVIGARSALFAPLKDIGIIIVDEEHDISYKQDTSPRYNARDAAIIRGKFNNAVVVLGSATPSLESYHNAESGKYRLLELTKRATEILMPKIEIIDTSSRRLSDLDKDKREFFVEYLNISKAKFLSRELIISIDERLKKKEGVILLQNRRGFHSYLECIDCGNVEMCTNCSVALTYHKAFDTLKCHYCGKMIKSVKKCSNCGSIRIIPMGAGTEKVEEEIIKIFPDAKIKRMDSDVVSSGVKYHKTLKEFYDGNIDILVGTQIISKGLDFPNVTLVGVVNADIGLLNPDFRATEKTFQILTQVSGRSGRAKKSGEVLIQTYHPDFSVFSDIKNHDFIGFYRKEIIIRKEVEYPPFSRFTIIEVTSDDSKIAESKAKELFNLISVVDKSKVIKLSSPIQPLYYKLKNKYRWHLLLKSSKDKDPSGKNLNSILKSVQKYSSEKFPTKVRISIIVDALNLL